ncbi:MAG: N-acetylmuramic acid 6-phosphate etherase [Halanaerobiales bacterium]|nr:N-acetylmuramic acid 6-phosphate etherase [Halanaerobiales bacterium]
MVLRITEKRNPASMRIDRMDTEEILHLINREDAKVAEAVREEIPAITRAIEKIAARMKKGGRLFYVGAGTSGRLGVLDAVECLPTFSVEPDRVVGILAGGKKAMFLAQEDVEDSITSGVEAMIKHQVNELDSVVGIAASGSTPFVLGAIIEAKKRGAVTVALVCNHGSDLEEEVEIAITPIVGPEVITGSTRMKAGTAQKMILNMISTTVMIKLGKVYSNLMVDLKATNSKLRERAQVIFMTITGADEKMATGYLEKTAYNVKEAIVMFRLGVNLEKARDLLAEKDGLLAEVIDPQDED